MSRASGCREKSDPAKYVTRQRLWSRIAVDEADFRGKLCTCHVASQKGAVRPSRTLTGALLYRLTHHVNILEMNGESYRLNQSRARLTNAGK